ncbi:NrdJb [Wenzhouxiangella sediminis]|uniref:ribonucleoside-diphosphate reductase n=1 Tax=Wenzhouxiangella sediminis TaxID=1792836 RepID=A0A3E1K9Q0_9GAMM|nr:NrdJb [Wenzhouxiangella sediminis]RFF30937.1 NrdJb [Wenzhouxiangella sediminis]
MTIRIDKKIVDYAVQDKKKEEESKAAENNNEGRREKAEIIRMHEKLERPEGMECLEGATYKIRTPLDDHALYVTINDIVLNQGTEHEQRRPFEIFINSKNMDHFQWIVALTRVMSAVFRKGGDVTFLAEELQAVFDPKGGYFKPGGRFVPSIVADIGAVVENHLKRIGMIEPDELSEQQQLILEQKRAEAEAREQKQADAEAAQPKTGNASAGQGEEASYPASATLCHKCNTKAMVLLDGCQTCLACGYSKCG